MAIAPVPMGGEAGDPMQDLSHSTGFDGLLSAKNDRWFLGLPCATAQEMMGYGAGYLALKRQRLEKEDSESTGL